MIEWDFLKGNIVYHQLGDFRQMVQTLIDKKSLVLCIQIKPCLLIRLGACQINTCQFSFIAVILSLDLEKQMGATWIIVDVGVADLAILDSEFKSFP